jgi:hypothetical protein
MSRFDGKMPAHGKRKWEKPTGRMKPCVQCGKEFYCQPSMDIGGSLPERKTCGMKCYRIWQKHTPEMVIRAFWAKVDKTSSPRGCWLWTASRNQKGYARFNCHGKQHRAHRLAWELTRGSMPAGKELAHTCDVRHCVNPEHLYVATHQENVADMVMKGRRKTHRYTPVDQLLFPEQSKRR